MGSFNHRYAQPSNQSYPSFGHLYPFADQEMVDPLTQQSDGILKRLNDLNAVPKTIYTNSSAEYWRGDFTGSDTPGHYRLKVSETVRRRSLTLFAWGRTCSRIRLTVEPTGSFTTSV